MYASAQRGASRAGYAAASQWSSGSTVGQVAAQFAEREPLHVVGRDGELGCRARADGECFLDALVETVEAAEEQVEADPVGEHDPDAAPAV